MPLSIISDLHILDEHDPTLDSLIGWLRDQSNPQSHLVLAGDVFDLFVGNHSSFCERYKPFFRALTAAAQAGSTLHWIEGNHDLLIKNALNHFTPPPPIQIHTNSLELTLQNKRFFIAHGDFIDPMDWKYQLLRDFLRSRFFQGTSSAIPSAWIEFIGKKLSRYTQNPKLLTELETLTPVLQKRLENTIIDFSKNKIQEGFDFVILGHFHNASEFKIPTSVKSGYYYNVGFPRVHKTFLYWDPALARPERRIFSS